MTVNQGQGDAGRTKALPQLTAARVRYALERVGRGTAKGMGPASPGVAHLGARGAAIVATASWPELDAGAAEEVRAVVERELQALAAPCARRSIALYILDAHGQIEPVDESTAQTVFADPYEFGSGAMATVLVPYEPGWRDLDRLRGAVATHTGQVRVSGAARGPARALWNFLATDDPEERPEHATSLRRLPVAWMVVAALLAAPHDRSVQRAVARIWDIRLTAREAAELAPLVPAFRARLAELFSGALDDAILPVEDLETLLEAQLKRCNPPMMVGGGQTLFVTGAAAFRAASAQIDQRAIDAVDALHERVAMEPEARAAAVALGTPGLVDPREHGW